MSGLADGLEKSGKMTVARSSADQGLQSRLPWGGSPGGLWVANGNRSDQPDVGNVRNPLDARSKNTLRLG